MKAITTFLVVFSAVVLAACSGSGGMADRSLYRATLDTNTMNNIVQYTEQTLLSTYAYRFARRETNSPDYIRLETDWKEEPALEDERALGIQFVRTRITVNGRVANRTTGDIRARFTGEAQYRMTRSSEWVDAPLTDAREAYFQEIVDYLERQLRSSWRS